MKYVYYLEHIHKISNDNESAKLLGIFSTEENAKKAINKYKKLPGFKDFPDDFIIDKYQINETEWNSGFITSDGVDIPYWITE